MATYEKPELTDYGTLVELTAQGTMPNADVPQGNSNSAYSAAG